VPKSQQNHHDGAARDRSDAEEDQRKHVGAISK
jgi:hypothetical protein